MILIIFRFKLHKYSRPTNATGKWLFKIVLNE